VSLAATVRRLKKQVGAMTAHRGSDCGAPGCPPELPADKERDRDPDGWCWWQEEGDIWPGDGPLPTCPACGRTPERVLRVIFDPDFYHTAGQLAALEAWDGEPPPDGQQTTG
jgi:hypothetical protein